MSTAPDGLPLPAALVAKTVTAYGTPLVSPDTLAEQHLGNATPPAGHRSAPVQRAELLELTAVKMLNTSVQAEADQRAWHLASPS